MKKIKYLLIVLVCTLLFPMNVFADVKADKEFPADSNEVKVYVFRGEGCSHCAEAYEWFESIEEEYGDKFEIIGYETWKNADNDDLMNQISKARADGAEGVPYILVGDDAWNGFDESYEEPILNAILNEYDKDKSKRTDIVKEVMEGTYKTATNMNSSSASTDIVSAIILLVIVIIGGIIAGVYYYTGNKKTKKEVVVKKVPEKKTTTKKTTAKKTTTKKATKK